MNDGIEISPIKEFSSMLKVEHLQKEVWNFPDLEVVPAAHIAASVAAGGSLLGAWDGNRLVGFAYGFGGIEHGIVAHHSHMLAVLSEYRNRNLGRRLKLAQRDFVVSLGVGLMSWTFDPLQSANAHFNFRKLGAYANEYFVNFYGLEAGSPLHQTGTDRLWMQWDLMGTEAETREDVDLAKAKSIISGPLDSPSFIEDSFEAEDILLIPIPRNINHLTTEDRSAALSWRVATRKAFETAFALGYAALDFQRYPESSEHGGAYILRKWNK